MTCDDVRARVIDAIAMPHATLDAEVRAHLDSCAACRSASDDYTRMWRELGELAAPRAPSDARARFDRRLAEARHRSAVVVSRRTPWYVGAWAATALIAALAGYGLGIRHSGERARAAAQAAAAGGESTFLILLHVDSSFHQSSTPAASAATYAEYVEWANTLPSGVTLVSTARLADSAVWLGPPRTAGDQGDHLAGFLMIRTKDRAAAMRVAATCPHLKYGGRIELRTVPYAN